MTIRSLETRLAKLEGSQRPENSRYLIWYQGDPAPAYIAARDKFPSMSDAIMGEWTGDDPLPRNRWVKDIKADLTEAERSHLEGQLRTRRKADVKPERVTPQQQARLTEMSDTELWFEILRVDHEPRIH